MSDTADLQAAYETAEQKAFKLQADRDDAIAKVREKYNQKIKDANDVTAVAQKAYLDALAADGLRDRPDGQAVAQALGLTLD